MNDNVYPMNELCERLLGVVSRLSASRTGLRFLDRYFTEPIALGSCRLPNSAAVYAILVGDPGWQPRPYRPIYFGGAGDLAGEVAASHEKYQEWLRAASADQVYVAYHLTSGSDAERAALEEALRTEYRPECNQTPGDRYGQLSNAAAGG